ncbi:hypothetical protein COS75_02960 [Candidatus Pacearchaeota archaeon CG06_land_8_20_14_3_00_35_12]|nr:MAG: hypothetical protein COS75_02960 [Candidatus Pacearchaeota archaeon CG06_land_8_20_14_3_00_35_12]
MVKININKLSIKEKGYLLGLFAGDGYAHHNKKDRHYTAEFYLNSERDKKTKDFLISLLEKVGLNVFVFKDKRCDCVRIRVHSKEFYFFCLDMKYNENTDFKIGFISGFIDSDGFVNWEKSTINIVNTNLELLKKAQRFLEDVSIKSTLSKRVFSKKDRKVSYIMNIPVRFKSVPHISQKCGVTLSIAG